MNERDQFEERIATLEHVLGTLISWLGRDLGYIGVKHLLDLLNKENKDGTNKS